MTERKDFYKEEFEMMSQGEIKRMQAYCEIRNEMRRGGERKEVMLFTGWSLVMLLAGLVLAVVSLCLIAYVCKLGLAATNTEFIVIGVGGAIAGTTAAVLSKFFH